MTTQMPDVRHAATLVILREQAEGAPHVLMAERSTDMAFASGALVFPGGAVDAADRELAQQIAGPIDVDDAAARVAGIRESLEEAGLAVGFNRLCSADMTREMRAALLSGVSFGRVIEDFGIALDIAQLVPFARWLPNHRNMKRFDTRFYIVHAAEDTAHIAPDMSETRSLLWASAQDVLTMADEGKAKIIFPTRRNLERIAQFASIADAHAHATKYPVTTITPWIEMRGGADHLCIPEGAGYPVTSERLDLVKRG